MMKFEEKTNAFVWYNENLLMFVKPRLYESFHSQKWRDREICSMYQGICWKLYLLKRGSTVAQKKLSPFSISPDAIVIIFLD